MSCWLIPRDLVLMVLMMSLLPRRRVAVEVGFEMVGHLGEYMLYSLDCPLSVVCLLLVVHWFGAVLVMI